MREPSLDVLRGIAILGTFASNVWLFAQAGGPQAGVAAGPPLVNGVFLGMLTLLFGIGMELQNRSAARRPGRHLWRAAILLVEGALHYVLVFEFDVLMGYALTSVLVAYLIGRSDRVQKAWMWTVGSVFAVLMAVGSTVPLGGAPGPDLGYLDQVRGRLEYWPVYRAEIAIIVPFGVVLFLLGARLFRAGLLDGRGAALRRRLMVLGAVALPVKLLAGSLFLVERYLLGPLVALGMVAAVVEIVRRGWRPRGLTAVGRTALSCYVLQNVLASVVCYRWGLGLAGPEVWRVVLIWAAVGAVCTACAVLWLRRADRGPIELVAHAVLSSRVSR